MNVKVMGLDGEKGSIALPDQFSEQIRLDIVQRAWEALRSHRQSYGADPRAGKKASAKLSRRRRNFRGAYGHGISRVPRKIVSRQGTQHNWIGAFAPGTVGGRRAHPPTSAKIWLQKINDRERLMALRGALASTMSKDFVSERGHKVPVLFPLVLDARFEQLPKTKQFVESLVKMGFGDELSRASRSNVRPGRGKLRGRRLKKPKGLLVVVSADCALLKSGKNIAGCDVVVVHKLNAKLLAPGGIPGRLTLFTVPSIERLRNERLFMVKHDGR